MGPRTVFTFLMVSNVALATPLSQFFSGKEAVHVTSRDSINNSTSRLIVQKLEEYGLNATNFREHGYTSSRYKVEKGRKAMPVIYFDVRNLVTDGNDIQFDVVYTEGTDVIVEEAAERVVANCHGTNNNGQIKLRLNDCIANAMVE